MDIQLLISGILILQLLTGTTAMVPGGEGSQGSHNRQTNRSDDPPAAAGQPETYHGSQSQAPTAQQHPSGSGSRFVPEGVPSHLAPHATAPSQHYREGGEQLHASVHGTPHTAGLPMQARQMVEAAFAARRAAGLTIQEPSWAPLPPAPHAATAAAAPGLPPQGKKRKASNPPEAAAGPSVAQRPNAAPSPSAPSSADVLVKHILPPLHIEANAAEFRAIVQQHTAMDPVVDPSHRDGVATGASMPVPIVDSGADNRGKGIQQEGHPGAQQPHPIGRPPYDPVTTNYVKKLDAKYNMVGTMLANLQRQFMALKHQQEAIHTCMSDPDPHGALTEEMKVALCGPGHCHYCDYDDGTMCQIYTGSCVWHNGKCENIQG